MWQLFVQIGAPCRQLSYTPRKLHTTSLMGGRQGSQKTRHFLSSSPTGWTNIDVGLAWLEQVFNHRTKQKARPQREWRLLILDGYGSHRSMEFIEFCEANRILLAVFPPHSTHTLHPHDAVCFIPLSSNYTSALNVHLSKTQGMLPVLKDDFLTLLWGA